MCEVEFDGVVKYSGKLPPNQKWYYFVGMGDCMDKDVQIIGLGTMTAEGRFSSEVFTKWGTDVSFCAAAVEAPDKPATIYGKAPGTFHAEKAGEVEFRGLVIAPKPGPKKTFPKLNVNFDLTK